MKITVYLPDDLGKQVKAIRPPVNVSAVLQGALREMFDHQPEPGPHRLVRWFPRRGS